METALIFMFGIAIGHIAAEAWFDKKPTVIIAAVVAFVAGMILSL